MSSQTVDVDRLSIEDTGRPSYRSTNSFYDNTKCLLLAQTRSQCLGYSVSV